MDLVPDLAERRATLVLDIDTDDGRDVLNQASNANPSGWGVTEVVFKNHRWAVTEMNFCFGKRLSGTIALEFLGASSQT
jgi:hypothetical protein